MVKLKTLHPAPIYSATYENGNVVRLSFQQQIGKPFDVTRMKRLADLMVAGEAFRALPCPPELTAAREAAHVLTAARDVVERLKKAKLRDRDALRAAENAERDALIVYRNAELAAVPAFDAHATAENIFKLNYSTALSAAQISHATIGTIDALAIETAPKKAKRVDIAAAVREIIKDAIDADSALARIAALVNA